MGGMMWEHSIIKEIFSKKQSEKSEDRDNLLRLTSRQLYGETIHYALELIQNAEDEDSASITFMFNNDNLSVLNDGKAFDEKDVWRICSVRPGEKKKKIGFFGIGFKSVFNISEKPQIISGKFNFEITEYIYPKGKSSIPEDVKAYYSPERGAILILPYSESSNPKELIDNFNLIDDKILLFLDNIKEIKFIDNVNNDNWVIKKNLQNDSIVSLLNMVTGEETKWRVFHKTLRVEDNKIVPEGKEGIKETKITIAFPLDISSIDNVKKSGVLYCYLPTKKRTDLPFLIQADFLPTIGRENVSEHQWNSWIMNELGILAATVIDKIKSDKQFFNLIYEFIPLSEEIQDVLIRSLYESFFEVLKEKHIAKTTKGWVNPENCVIPSNDKIRDLLLEADLKSLLKKEVFYIDSNSSERTKNVLFELGARRIGPKEVIDFLKNKNIIINKDKDWFLKIYEYLSIIFDTPKSFFSDFMLNWNEEMKALFKELEKIQFILTDDDNLISLKDPKKLDRLICYPQRIDLSEVHQLFTEGEIVFLNRYFQESSILRRKKDNELIEERRKIVKEWFDSIGVKKYFRQVNIIKEIILPKFITGKYKKYSDQKLYRFINYIRKYWSTIESEIKNKKHSANLIKEIKNSILLKSFCYKDGNKTNDYKKPNEIYFSVRYGKNMIMEKLFEGLNDIHFVSSYYINREKTERKMKKRGRKKVEYTWRKFFEIMEVWSSPRIVKEDKGISISGKKEFGWIERKYSTRGTHEIFGDSYSEDTERLIDYCYNRDNQSNIHNRMHILWQSLENNWKFYKSKYCKIRYKWFYRYDQFKDYETSSFLEFLRTAKWVPGKDGGFYRPKDLFTDTKLNNWLVGDDVKFVSLKADETFLKDLGIRIQPNIEEVVNHLISYKNINQKPTENKIEKMSAIYRFLKNEIDNIEESENKMDRIRDIRRKFNNKVLIYLPREDKVWWKPSHIFWKDYSNIFGTMRGYIEHNGMEFYENNLKEFFFSLKVVENPLVNECLDVLEELKEKENIELYSGVISGVYTYLNEIVKQDLDRTDWDRKVFLSENGHFLKPSEIYYNDNDEYKEYFVDLEIIWLDFSWFNVKEFLHAAGFRSLSKNVTVVKKFGNIIEIEGDTTNQLILRLSLAENYSKKKNIELYRKLQKEGVFQRVKEVQAFEIPEIFLDYLFKRDDSETIVINNVKKDVYFSFDENRIYKSSQIDLLSTPVAKELSKIFLLGEDYLFPFLDSMFTVSNDEELNEKLKYFGIRSEETFIGKPREEIRIIPLSEKSEHEAITFKPERQKKKIKLSEKGVEKPQLPESQPQVKKSDLINPDEFIFDTIVEHTPYLRIDGSPTVPKKTIKLKTGSPGSVSKEYKPRERFSRIDAETIALLIVMRFEEIVGREPDDRHKQQGIGYDIYSKTKDGMERLIEVKHFRGNPGTFELTRHQWEKAEIEKEKFFVYIVSGLRVGGNLKLEIIQNPAKYLTPDPAIRKTISNWKNGVIEMVNCKKV